MPLSEIGNLKRHVVILILLQMDTIDIVWSLPPEYMHRSVMGIVQQLFVYWRKHVLTIKQQARLRKNMSTVRLSCDLG